MQRNPSPKTFRFLLLFGIALLLGGCIGTGFGSSGPSPFGRGSFRSNGERIYYTGTSANGRISYKGGGLGGIMGGGMMGGRLACADCHGDDGRGGAHFMHMTRMDAPDIRWSTLTSTEHDGAEMDHPPFDAASFKSAVTRGIDPGGDPLDGDMPRWRMSDQDIADLIAFLKELP